MKHVGVRTDVADIASQAQIQEIDTDIKVLRHHSSANVGGVISGVYYDNSCFGAASATLAASAGLIAAVPYMSPVDMAIDRMAIVVTVLASAGTADMHIYESLENGWPGNKLYSSASVLTTSIGKKEVTLSFTFEAGKTYWLAIRASVAVSIRGIALAGCKSFGMITADGSGSAYATGLVQTSIMGSGAAPSPWGPVSFSQLSSIVAPSIRFRAV